MSGFVSTPTPTTSTAPCLGRPRSSSASSTASTASSQQSDPELDAFLGLAAPYPIEDYINLTSHDSSSDDSYDGDSDGGESTDVWLEHMGWKKSLAPDDQSVNQDEDELIRGELDGTTATCDGLCCKPLTDAEADAGKQAGRRNNGQIVADRIAYRFAQLKWKMSMNTNTKSDTDTDTVGPPDILTKGYPEFFKFPARRMSTPAADPPLAPFACAKCHKQVTEGAVAPCAHTFCNTCAGRFFAEDACPCCQAPFMKRILASYNPYPQYSDEDCEVDSFAPRTYGDTAGADDLDSVGGSSRYLRRKSVFRQIVCCCIVPI
ncbi:hypothetical protein FIBSPDRAFT_961101 [Athelia psychrophila]|uniref:RING-type domain-containing protein n=1 Tax=Athelia psychrophila TaxID=1759441 RepID=A0A166BM31_9AGAM|nr:hypothetical protein FIBSPDRAFT_961101 [Fibularhizoctonia sp. CBS 109695]